jgi:uncharacterized repeat protein (TIGR01451 family)
MKTIFFVFLLSIFSVKLIALNPADFAITRISAPYFIVDANAPSTITKAYVGFEVTNMGSISYSGMLFAISSIGTSVTGQDYTVLSPSSRQVIIGSLAPGQSKVCYFYISYPASTIPVASFHVRLSDATENDKTQTFSIYNRSSISANAGGIATQAFANQDALGGLIIDTVTYTVGNVQLNDESDFQVAVSSQFDPTKMELLSTSVIQSNVPGIPTGTTDSIYFRTGNGSNGASVKIVWRFRIKGFGFTNYLLPCAGATSGASNYKYALNSSLVNGSAVTVASNANPLLISKSSNKSYYSVCEQAVFTVTISNPGSVDVIIDSLVDQLPTGFTYQSLNISSGINTSNSVQYPTGGISSSLKYVGGVSLPAAVSYLIPAGGTLQLIYNATASCTTALNLKTTVRGFIGSLEFDNAENTVSVFAILPVAFLNTNISESDKGVQIKWNVYEEDGPYSYTVQHSMTGQFWADEGVVHGHQVKSANAAYAFTPTFVSGGIHFYRIVVRSQSGKQQYGEILSYNRLQPVSKLKILGNPVIDGQIRIAASVPGSIELVHPSGKRIWLKEIRAGNHRFSVSELSNGLYWMRFGNEQIPLIIH